MLYEQLQFFFFLITCPTQCYAVYKEIQISFHSDEKQAASLVLPKEKDMLSHQHWLLKQNLHSFLFRCFWSAWYRCWLLCRCCSLSLARSCWDDRCMWVAVPGFRGMQHILTRWSILRIIEAVCLMLQHCSELFFSHSVTDLSTACLLCSRNIQLSLAASTDKYQKEYLHNCLCKLKVYSKLSSSVQNCIRHPQILT